MLMGVARLGLNAAAFGSIFIANAGQFRAAQGLFTSQARIEAALPHREELIFYLSPRLTQERPKIIAQPSCRACRIWNRALLIPLAHF